MSVTKNRQTRETLQALARAAFPDRQAADITELTEGMFNAAYRITFADGSASILKIAAADISGLMTNEVSLMQAEVTTLQLLRRRGIPLIPQVQFSDFSRTLCSGPYFFMTEMPGRSLHSCASEIGEEAVSTVMRGAGRLQRSTTAIRGTHFGLAGDDRRFPTLHALVHYMVTNVLGDAARAGVSFCFAPEALLACLERDRTCFDEVTTPRLVHLDMWAGNLFVHEGRLSGVIDWERALWGDPLMDDPFRSQNQHPAFLAGYGMTRFTPAEERRIRWYDAFLDMTMITECYYRQYGSEDWLRYLHARLEGAWQALQRSL